MKDNYTSFFSTTNMQLVAKQCTITSLGQLSKAWYMHDSKQYLVKGNCKFSRGHGWEPYSEAIASQVAEVLALPHIDYTLAPSQQFPEVKTYNLDVVSVCQEYNIPPAAQKLSALNYMEAYYERHIDTNYWGLFMQLPFDKHGTLDMLVFDAIIGNIDRHLNNWEYIMHPSGDIQLMPIYDCGESLLAHLQQVPHLGEEQIGPDTSKPFKDFHVLQMKLIQKYYPNYHFSRDPISCWKDIDSRIVSILGMLPEMRATAIRQYLHNRCIYFLEMMR